MTITPAVKSCKDGVTCAEVLDVTIHATDHVHHSLTDRDQQTHKLLSAAEQDTILFKALVHVDNYCSAGSLASLD